MKPHSSASEENTLHPHERKDFDAAFEPPIAISHLKTDEICRRFEILVETPTHLTLLFANKAVVEIDAVDGTATAIELIEGEAARGIIDRVGFQVSVEDRALAARVLVPGADPSAVPSALTDARLVPWAKLYIRPDEEGKVARHGASPGAILEVHFSINGPVAGHRWLEGLAAWRGYHKARSDSAWKAAEFPGGVREALHQKQAALFVAIQGAELQQSFEADGCWCALGLMPARTMFRFRFTKSAGAEALLEPTELLTFAEAKLEALGRAKVGPWVPIPGASRLAQVEAVLSRPKPEHSYITLWRWRRDATAAVKAALALIPSGEGAIPTALIQSPAGPMLLATQPDFFSRARIEALLAALGAA